MAQVYGFHGAIGLNTAAGTAYLPPAEAVALGRALIVAARMVAAGEWPETANGIASFAHTADALNVTAALGRKAVRAKAAPDVESRVAWHGQYKAAGRWKTVTGKAGPIVYQSRAAALAAATYEESRYAGF